MATVVSVAFVHEFVGSRWIRWIGTPSFGFTSVLFGVVALGYGWVWLCMCVCMCVCVRSAL